MQSLCQWSYFFITTLKWNILRIQKFFNTLIAITFGKVIRCPSNASVIRQATIAVDRRYIVRTICTILIASRLLGFIHAFIAGDAVLSKFQSNLKQVPHLNIFYSKQRRRCQNHILYNFVINPSIETGQNLKNWKHYMPNRAI